MSLCKLNTVVIFLLANLLSSVASATDIRLQTLTNESVSLNTIINNGRHTLVMIWAVDCPPCEEQKPMVQQFHSEFHKTKANVIGVVIDGLKNIDEVNRLIEKNSPTYENYLADPATFLNDFTLTTGKQFTGAPTYILFDELGNSEAVAIGPVTRAQLHNAILF